MQLLVKVVMLKQQELVLAMLLLDQEE